MMKLAVNQALYAQGLQATQTLGVFFDGIARHTPGGLRVPGEGGRRGLAGGGARARRALRRLQAVSGRARFSLAIGAVALIAILAVAGVPKTDLGGDDDAPARRAGDRHAAGRAPSPNSPTEPDKPGPRAQAPPRTPTR